MKILNAKGEPILLNAKEQHIADYNQRMVNALGFEVPITTLTTIVKKVTEQKFFEVAPADYIPVRVGEGAWSTNLITYRSFNIADDFATGVVNLGGGSSRLASASAGVDSVTVPIKNWAKSCDWSLFELQHAAKAGNWDIVTSVVQARKKNWDLGIQKVAFLGLAGDANVKGLLTQADVTSNTAILTEKLSGMTSAELSTFCGLVYGTYRSNASFTCKPTHFVIPEGDFNGLASQASDVYPIKNKLQILEETFQTITMNKSFKILPLAYADKAVSGLGVDRYTLLNYADDSVRMDLPVDITVSMQNSLNGFNFQNVGYGQFTGVKAYRPKEMLYLDF